MTDVKPMLDFIKQSLITVAKIVKFNKIGESTILDDENTLELYIQAITDEVDNVLTDLNNKTRETLQKKESDNILLSRVSLPEQGDEPCDD